MLHHYRPCALALLAVLYLGAARTGTPVEPARIIRITAGWRIDLAAGLEAALRQFDPRLRLLEAKDFLPTIVREYRYDDAQCPAAVIGDFDGNGRLDLIAYADAGNGDLLLLKVSAGAKRYRVGIVDRAPRDWRSNWYVIEPGRREYGVWAPLSLMRARILRSPFEDEPLVLRHDALVVTWWEKASAVYYWDRGRMTRYTLSD